MVCVRWSRRPRRADVLHSSAIYCLTSPVFATKGRIGISTRVSGIRVQPQAVVVHLMFDAALRRTLRQKLGSRTSRRQSTNRPGQIKPRQKLAELVVQWAKEQRRAATRPPR